jgi:hypothetical protein
MTKFKFTQVGTFSLAIMVPVFIFSLVMLFTSGMNDPAQIPVFAIIIMIFLICLLIFYKLTIYIDENYVGFSLGIGLIKKKYPVSEIKSCRAVKNSPFTGLGIRKILNGWLFNVSGLNAIELTFRNNDSVIRIGTDKPEEVSQIINRLIHNNSYSVVSDEASGKSYRSLVILIAVAVILPAALIISGNRETVVKTTGNDFTIEGMYGVTIRYPDIIQLDTLADLPGIKLRTNGYAFGKTLKGKFMLYDNSRVKLFIRKGNPPYINIKTQELSLWINFKDAQHTRELYKVLKTSQPDSK